MTGYLFRQGLINNWKQIMLQAASTLSHKEVERFSLQAEEWWNPRGSFRMLHELMPLRVEYVLLQCASDPNAQLPLKGKRVLDMGCGGGLMSEALSKLGADVIGVDASAKAIEVAREHAQKNNLNIDYREGTVDSLSQDKNAFDIIIAFEIVEHVGNLSLFLKLLAQLLKPEGQMLLATMNRTRRSFLLGIVAAEYIMRFVPMGTHDWDRFVKPSEIVDIWRTENMRPTDIRGMVYKPLSRRFELSRGKTAVNYFICGKKLGG